MDDDKKEMAPKWWMSMAPPLIDAPMTYNSTLTLERFYENAETGCCQRHSANSPWDHVRISGSRRHRGWCRNGSLRVFCSPGAHVGQAAVWTAGLAGRGPVPRGSTPELSSVDSGSPGVQWALMNPVFLLLNSPPSRKANFLYKRDEIIKTYPKESGQLWVT